jgi:aryl-alcohol dehydrogenase-like predicted oxidoreductase
MGTIIKRPIAGGVWGKSRPEAGIDDAGRYNTPYLERAKAIRALGDIENEPGDGILTALGYTLGDPNVSVAIVGTTNPSHMATNIKQIDNDLPIQNSVIAELNRRFEELDTDWAQRT